MHSHLVWVMPRWRTQNNQLSLVTVTLKDFFAHLGIAREVSVFSVLLRENSPITREASSKNLLASVAEARQSPLKGTGLWPGSEFLAPGVTPPQLLSTWQLPNTIFMCGIALTRTPLDTCFPPPWQGWHGPSQGDQQALRNGPAPWPRCA